MITILIWYGQKLLSLPVVFDLAGSLNDACGRGDITKSVGSFQTNENRMFGQQGRKKEFCSWEHNLETKISCRPTVWSTFVLNLGINI
jgi:hypothetical protein